MPTAVVLAGGVGSRLSPLTKIVPKPLVPFAGAPLLEYIISFLENNGFDNILITARYLGEQIVKYFQGRRNVTPLLLDSKDTADAVRLVARFIKGDFIVSMGDVVTNIPYKRFFEYHLSHREIASIVLKEVDNPLPYGLVYMDPNSNIVLFSEKPPSLEIYLISLAFHGIKSKGFYSNLVNAGIYAFREELLDILLENQGLMDFGRHVFPFLLEAGYRIKGWIAPADTYWNDIGRVEVYKEALWDFLDNKVLGWNHRGVVYSKGVVVGEESEVHGEIYPPVYIGRNTIVESGARIGPYVVLEEGVRVESGARLSYSVVWHNSVIQRNSYIYDSVLMNNTVVKEGVKVVSSIVGTGCVVERDLFNTVLEPCLKVSPYEVKG